MASPCIFHFGAQCSGCGECQMCTPHVHLGGYRVPVPLGAIVDENADKIHGLPYLLGKDEHGEAWILCLTCRMKSFHPIDVRELYCGCCREFHAR